jgi:hypothetical protein
MLQLNVRSSSSRPNQEPGRLRDDMLSTAAIECGARTVKEEKKNKLWPGLCKQFEAARYARAEAGTGPEAEMRRRDPS